MIHSKLPATGTTIFSVMSQLAVQHGAINLGQGFPGFPIDERLIDLVSKAMNDGFNQYAPMPGLPVLRETIAAKMNVAYSCSYDPDTEITITAGGTQAIYTTISAFIHPGDEVILFAPAYDCYAPAIEINGGKVKWIELDYPEFSMDWNKVESLITPQTRMIIINTPLNPAATVFSRNDLNQLERIAESHDLLVLSDEVYEHIVFDGKAHCSVALSELLRQRSILIYSFGKTFHATGWKMGYAMAPKHLMSEFRKVHQYLVFSCNTPIQVALHQYMQDTSTYQSLPSFYQRKRDLFLSHLEGSRFQFQQAAGSYFQLLNYSTITNGHDVDVAKLWTAEHKVASIPISVFYPSGKDQHVLRFCFAKSDEQLIEAATILKQL